jgi:hypothetical protein
MNATTKLSTKDFTPGMHVIYHMRVCTKVVRNRKTIATLDVPAVVIRTHGVHVIIDADATAYTIKGATYITPAHLSIAK